MSEPRRGEYGARAWLLLAVVVLPAIIFGYEAQRLNPAGVRVITIIARAPVDGGWQPDAIRVGLGEQVRLRIVADDVVHGMVIPALGIDVNEIQPGHAAEVKFTANQPGRFAFECSRWCSVDHWRMRGVIEVVDPAGAATNEAAPPLYQQLGIDLDAMRQPVPLPGARPSPTRGAAVAAQLAGAAIQPGTSPHDLFARWRADPDGRYTNDAQVWDAVAYTWQRASSAESLANGRQLYARDCAACHGERGRGDGTAGRNLLGLAAMRPSLPRGPRDFTDVAMMLGASDTLLEGKVIRGGMGTGMPEWRSLYTDADVRDVIRFVRQLGWAEP